MKRPEIEQGMVMLGITGSHAYGTNIEGSDVDLKGITIPPLDYFFSTKRFDQKDSWSDNEPGNMLILDDHKDVVVYSLSKFMELVVCQNPNILDLLWLPDVCVLHKTAVYDHLKVYREFFLSKKAYGSFSGYANAQIGKMEKHRTWLLAEAEGKVVVKPQAQSYLPEELCTQQLLSKSELYAFYEFLVCMLKDRFQYFNEYPEFVKLGGEIDWTGVIKQHGLPDEAMDFIQITTKCSDNYLRLLNGTQTYMADMRRYESWLSWKKNRNPERAALELKCGFDGKNAAHCLRLQFMLIEILKEGVVHVRRTSDAEYLKAVRTGQISYEEVMEMSTQLKLDGKEALSHSTLPTVVDKGYIDKLLTSIYSVHFKCG